MNESFVIEVRLPDGSWIEVERIVKPPDARWNGAFMDWRQLLAGKVRTRFEQAPVATTRQDGDHA